MVGLTYIWTHTDSLGHSGQTLPGGVYAHGLCDPGMTNPPCKPISQHHASVTQQTLTQACDCLPCCALLLGAEASWPRYWGSTCLYDFGRIHCGHGHHLGRRCPRAQVQFLICRVSVGPVQLSSLSGFYVYPTFRTEGWCGCRFSPLWVGSVVLVLSCPI